MTTKIILSITLLTYAMIASQAFMYILSLKRVQLNLGANAYTEIRKLTDISMRASFKYVIYTTLLANMLLVMVTAKMPDSLVFITSIISLVALIAEILLTVKCSLRTPRTPDGTRWLPISIMTSTINGLSIPGLNSSRMRMAHAHAPGPSRSMVETIPVQTRRWASIMRVFPLALVRLLEV